MSKIVQHNAKHGCDLTGLSGGITRLLYVWANIVFQALSSAVFAAKSGPRSIAGPLLFHFPHITGLTAT